MRGSVISCTCAIADVTSLTRPTSPSPETTGSSTSIPSPEPAFTPTVELMTLGEREMIRAVTGLYEDRARVVVQRQHRPELLVLVHGGLGLGELARAAASSSRSSSFSPRASNVSSNQFTRSRPA